MNIKPLNRGVIAKIRSSSDISSVAQCVHELVCNSLDAKSTAIAIRINLQTFRIQVADNGLGISRQDLELVGTRYATSKCQTVKDLERYLKTYGYRGEAIASILEMSHSLMITSRSRHGWATFTKILSRGRPSDLRPGKARPSVGTTVTVRDWLSAAPVRQQRIVEEIELEEAKRQLEGLIIINPGTSFSLRNDATGQLLINSPKHPDIVAAFHQLYPHIGDYFSLLKVAKGKLSIELLIEKELVATRQWQFIYVNKRPVQSAKIIKHFHKRFQASAPSKRYPVFIMNIKCPQVCVDSLRVGEVEFTCWDQVLASVDKLSRAFLGVEASKTAVQTPPKLKRFSSGVSQLIGAVQATGYKRKRTEHVLGNGGMTQTTGDYRIEDSALPAPPAKAPRRSPGLKKPLGIVVVPKLDVQQFDQRSIYSRLNNDENRGKGLILDMFLKSTQVFRHQSTGSSQGSFEESNYVLENNIQDATRGINATMSISVNVKRRKKKTMIKRCSLEEERMALPSRVLCNKSVQTSQKGRPESFQCELDQCTPDMDDDYTIVVNTEEASNRYALVRKSKEAQQEDAGGLEFKPLNMCCCTSGNMFNFREVDAGGGGLAEWWPAQQRQGALFRGLKRQHSVKTLGGALCTQSPYFGHSPKGQLSPFKQFRPPFRSTQMRPHGSASAPSAELAQLLTSNSEIVFKQPERIREEQPVSDWLNLKSSPDIFHDDESLGQLKTVCDLEHFGLIPSRTETQSILEISLGDEPDRMGIEGEDHEAELLPRASSKFVLNSQNQWLKCSTRQGGRFFVNQRTGMVSSKSPALTQTNFAFGTRLDFVPKGMSPVLQQPKEVDGVLSQNARTKLQSLILEGYEDELVSVKWRNCPHQDTRAFFEEIYREKCKQYEECIPRLRGRPNQVTFSKSMFHSLQVIGQLDRKFLVAHEPIGDLLILFDQHAVDERIRLERFLQEYRGLKVVLKHKLTIFLPHNDLGLLQRHTAYLDAVGLGVEFFTNGLHITHIPLCIQEKVAPQLQEETQSVNFLLNALVKDVVEFLRSTRGSTGQSMPRIIQQLINLKACRGAVKFGDELSTRECVTLLQALVKCQLPFQCAHGRPTLAPVATLTKLRSSESPVKPCLRKLLVGKAL